MPLSGQAKRDYDRRWVAARRAEYLRGRSCVLCGSTERLEIDHVNRRDKVSHRIWSWSRERLEAELAKCVILCRRCHQERHALERPKHGGGGYKRGCRCEICVDWKRQAAAKYRKQKAQAGIEPAFPALQAGASTTPPLGQDPNVPLVPAAISSVRANFGERGEQNRWNVPLVTEASRSSLTGCLGGC